MKRRHLLLTILVLFVISTASASASIGLQGLFIDGLPVNITGAILSGGSYFVPVRPLAESMGLSVHWDERLRRAHLGGADMEIVISTTASMQINGSGHLLGKRPFLRQGQLYVPLRAFAEALGGQVDYVGGVEKVYLYMPDSFSGQVVIKSAEINALVYREEATVGVLIKSNAKLPTNAVVLITAEDGRMDLVNWVDKHSDLPLTVMHPENEYDTSLKFPLWVNGVDLVTVTWVDSTRFRGDKPQDLDSVFSFVISFRHRAELGSGRSIN